MEIFVKEAIENNIELIEQEQFDELYSKLTLDAFTGKLTYILLQAEIPIFHNLKKLPEYFLAFIRDPSFEVTIPGNFKILPANGLYWSKVKSIKLKEGIQTIQANAFDSCKAEEFILPSTLRYIGRSAFQNSNIRSIDIPEGLKTINRLCFYDCLELKSVKVPSSVIKIGDAAFSHCQDLDIIYNGTKADWQSIFNKKAFYKSTFICHCIDGDIIYP